MKCNKKKLVFVADHLFGGGSERVLTLLANSFNQKGYEVSIIAFHSDKSYPLNDGVKVCNISNPNNLLLSIIDLRKSIKRSESKVLISFGYSINILTLIACVGLKIRTIVSERNDPSRVGGGSFKRILRNIVYRRCSILVCQTEDARRYFPKSIQKKSVIIMNPIKNDLPKPYLGKRNKEIVNFCRLHKQKNLYLLIDAFVDFHIIHQDYVLKIYGDGPERDNIVSYLYQHGNTSEIELVGNVSDVHHRIIESAMFVSSSDFEGLSNSMLEAMAIGLPVICTDCPCGGARMIIVDGKNGILVPVRNKEELTKAMERIVTDEKLSQRLSSNAILIREELSIDTISKEWEEIL